MSREEKIEENLKLLREVELQDVEEEEKKFREEEEEKEEEEKEQEKKENEFREDFNSELDEGEDEVEGEEVAHF